MGSMSVWHWLIVLVIILLVFGTKKLRNIGSDLGGAVKGFKQGVRDGSAEDKTADGTGPEDDRRRRQAQVLSGRHACRRAVAAAAPTRRSRSRRSGPATGPIAGCPDRATFDFFGPIAATCSTSASPR